MLMKLICITFKLYFLTSLHVVYFVLVTSMFFMDSSNSYKDLN